MDRLVAFSALIAFAKVQQSNRGYLKHKEKDKSADSLEKSKNLYKLSSNPFKNLGRSRRTIGGKKFKKSPFKNIK